MVKWLNVAMDDELKDKLDKFVKSNHKNYTQFFKNIVKENKVSVKIEPPQGSMGELLKTEIKPIEKVDSINPVVDNPNEPSKKELMENWTKYINQDDWDDGMVNAVNKLKFAKKEEMTDKLAQCEIEMKKSSYPPEDIKLVTDKVKELKQLFIEDKFGDK